MLSSIILPPREASNNDVTGVCVCVCVCVCVRACVRACVRVCVGGGGGAELAWPGAHASTAAWDVLVTVRLRTWQCYLQ
jgi:hypothetical protein